LPTSFFPKNEHIIFEQSFSPFSRKYNFRAGHDNTRLIVGNNAKNLIGVCRRNSI